MRAENAPTRSKIAPIPNRNPRREANKSKASDKSGAATITNSSDETGIFRAA